MSGLHRTPGHWRGFAKLAALVVGLGAVLWVLAG